MTNSCEQFETEIYTLRPGQPISAELEEHLHTCQTCANEIERIREKDSQISRVVDSTPYPAALEGRILAQVPASNARRSWRNSRVRWLFVPIAAMLFLIAVLSLRPRIETMRFRRDLAALVSHPPQSDVASGDREQLLAWSAEKLGPFELPPQLHNVSFRAASLTSVASHKAVLLKMKNEERASLLVVNEPIGQPLPPDAIGAGSSNLSWTDAHRTYVLLFRGSQEEMQAYAHEMGILT